MTKPKFTFVEAINLHSPVYKADEKNKVVYIKLGDITIVAKLTKVMSTCYKAKLSDDITIKLKRGGINEY